LFLNRIPEGRGNRITTTFELPSAMKGGMGGGSVVGGTIPVSNNLKHLTVPLSLN
jgi:hypothetical protein